MDPQEPQNDFCPGCSQRDDCKKMYEVLGRAKGPSVTWPVLLVFVVPILLFIVGISVVERHGEPWIGSETGRILAGAMAGLVLAGLYVAVLRMIYKPKSGSDTTKIDDGK